MFSAKESQGYSARHPTQQQGKLVLDSCFLHILMSESCSSCLFVAEDEELFFNLEPVEKNWMSVGKKPGKSCRCLRDLGQQAKLFFAKTMAFSFFFALSCGHRVFRSCDTAIYIYLAKPPWSELAPDGTMDHWWHTDPVFGAKKNKNFVDFLSEIQHWVIGQFQHLPLFATQTQTQRNLIVKANQKQRICHTPISHWLRFLGYVGFEFIYIANNVSCWNCLLFWQEHCKSPLIPMRQRQGTKMRVIKATRGTQQAMTSWTTRERVNVVRGRTSRHNSCRNWKPCLLGIGTRIWPPEKRSPHGPTWVNQESGWVLA